MIRGARRRIPAHTGFAWYRKRIEITGADKSLAILIPPVDDAYELYWNGAEDWNLRQAAAGRMVVGIWP